MLYFSSICVKFQPSEFIISINFGHFASLFDYVRGARESVTKNKDLNDDQSAALTSLIGLSLYIKPLYNTVLRLCKQCLLILCIR